MRTHSFTNYGVSDDDTEISSKDVKKNRAGWTLDSMEISPFQFRKCFMISDISSCSNISFNLRLLFIKMKILQEDCENRIAHQTENPVFHWRVMKSHTFLVLLRNTLEILYASSFEDHLPIVQFMQDHRETFDTAFIFHLYQLRLEIYSFLQFELNREIPILL